MKALEGKVFRPGSEVSLAHDNPCTAVLITSIQQPLWWQQRQQQKQRQQQQQQQPNAPVNETSQGNPQGPVAQNPKDKKQEMKPSGNPNLSEFYEIQKPVYP